MTKDIYSYFIGFLIALCGALLADFLHFPLPWMLGPLILTAITTMAGTKSKSHHYFRHIGQWVIGTSLGLYFTPSMIDTVLGLWHYILMGCGIAFFISLFNAFSLYRWGQVDFKTAWFAGLVGGASEMANLAEQYQAKVDRVASSHSVRVLIVVLIIPFAFKLLDIHGSGELEPFSTHTDSVSTTGLLKLLLLTLISTYVFTRLKIPNPWVLGPLFVTLLLTSQEIHLTHLSPSIKHLGQLCIGWSLGSKYGPDFFSKAPRYIIVSALISLTSLAICTIFAYLVSFISDISIPTLILSLSPGGIAEMTITANALMLGVPTVAIFHVARMIFILLAAQPCYLWLNRYITQKPPHSPR